GGGTAAATVRSTLRPEDGQTRVDVATSLSVTGRPAQFGRGVMAEVGAKIIEKFAANLAAELASAGQPSAGQAATEAVPHDGVQARSNGTGPAASVPRLAAPAQGSMALPIEGLNLPVRAFNTLRREGIHTVGDLTARTEPELLAFTNLGPQSVREICEKLSGLGLSLAATAEPGQADTATGVAQKLMAEAAGDTRGRIPVTDTAVTDMAQPPPPRPFRTADEEAIDLLRVAGFPVAKRLAPAVGASVALLLVYLGARRRRRRHRATRVGDGLH
ncbi:MAG TPA: DNA-directed RNA polymerase subunit alpha C-terminal domain-containing protein, partial [Streptosporangiaceae bacterium]|nr:DNA-directed RNA polymerase subunit alpha C-terminal domain-containing protein [Streptosporangiaceae bacterium]